MEIIIKQLINILIGHKIHNMTTWGITKFMTICRQKFVFLIYCCCCCCCFVVVDDDDSVVVFDDDVVVD